MAKLDNNTKMIVSKYLCGKDFINFVSTTPKLSTYYHSTFKYIIINTRYPLSNIIIKKIIKKLKTFENLNEIVLNFIEYNNIINDTMYWYKKYYNLFKTYTNIPIKINICDYNYKSYKYLFVKDNIVSNIIKSFKQPINILISSLSESYLKNVNLNYDLVYEFETLENIKPIFNKYQQIKNIYPNIKLYFTYNNTLIKAKIEEPNDFYKYFIVNNEYYVIGILKPQVYINKYITYLNSIQNFKMYYELFKIRKTNLNYLNNYITDANSIINDIIHFNMFVMNTLYNKKLIKIINMYKYGIKNIYNDELLNVDYIFDRLYIGDNMNKETIDYVLKNHKYKKYSYILRIIKNINNMVVY